MSKKTINLKDLVFSANEFMRKSANNRRQSRVDLFMFIEGFLHDNSAYRGFYYLDSAGVENQGTPQQTIQDPTRIMFYIDPDLS